MESHIYTNDLIKETSPYLLQHAHNPVNWKAWSKTALEQAKKENKPIIVSIGYAACHWCHVMEHESFEDPKVATVMNQNFINIKVDREERPDIDQVYMSAVQLMTGSGGWPLNIVALPDGRPVWGGTYFPKGNWMDALQQIADLYKKQPKKLVEYAEKLEQGIKSIDLISPNEEEKNFDPTFLSKTIEQWSNQFDHQKGGTKRVPKFMMPNNYHFLLRYAHQTKDSVLNEFVISTLDKISFGGVYDHIGGGFSRYSTDAKWHVPHFEKMLYDNAQLVSLYSDAFLATKNPWYKTVVYETLEFIQRELTSPEGAFYSSLDADSTNEQNKQEEGAFYIWKKEELQKILKDEYPIFADYYNINSYGHWEKDHYVLIKKESNTTIALKHKISEQELSKKILSWKTTLLKERSKRDRPGLDDKTLTSWNAMMLKGYIDAYRVFRDSTFLQIAIRNADFITKHQLQNDNSLLHNYKNGKSTINGYLEDYATTIEAFIALYQSTFHNKWLQIARELTDYTLLHFYDEEKQLFYFTSDLDPALITRTIEYQDNVIPASNSTMAKNLFLLYHYTGYEPFLTTSEQMLHRILPQIDKYGSGYSNWLDLMLNFSHTYYEIAIVGKDLKEFNTTLQSHYIPNKLMAGSIDQSNNRLLKNRLSTNKTLVYICQQNQCQRPYEEIKKVIYSLKK